MRGHAPEQRARSRFAEAQARERRRGRERRDAEAGEPNRVARDVHERTRRGLRRASSQHARAARTSSASAAASAPSDASVAVKPRSMTPAVPSSSGCARASSGLRELEAVPLELERRERRRPGRERMDGRAHVVPVTRERQLFGAGAAADLLGVASSSRTERPSAARSAAAVSPLGPAPTTTASYAGLVIRGCGAASTGTSPAEACRGIAAQFGPSTPKNDASGLGSGHGPAGPPGLPPGPRHLAPAPPAWPHGTTPVQFSESAFGRPNRPWLPSRTAPPIAGGASPGDQFGSPLPPGGQPHAQPCSRRDEASDAGAFTDDHLHTDASPASAPCAPRRVAGSRSASDLLAAGSSSRSPRRARVGSGDISQHPFLVCTRAHESDVARRLPRGQPERHVPRCLPVLAVDVEQHRAPRRPARPRRCRPRRGRVVGPGLPRAATCTSGRAASPWVGRCAGLLARVNRVPEGRLPLSSRPAGCTDVAETPPYACAIVTSPDLAIGGFTDDGPWVVDPDAMPWRADVAPPARARPHAQVPRWLRDRAPAAARPAGAGRRPGRLRARRRWAVRRAAPGRQRRASAALSRRLRIAFAHARPDLHQARPDHLRRRGAVPRRSSSPSSSCCATACRPSRSTHVRAGRRAGSRPLARRRVRTLRPRRRSRRRRSRRCTRRGCAPAKRSSSRCSGRRSRGSCARTSRRCRGSRRGSSAASRSPRSRTRPRSSSCSRRRSSRSSTSASRPRTCSTSRACSPRPGSARRSCPRPHPTLVTRRVLVMERLDGIPWDDVAAMHDAGVDTEAVLHAGLVVVHGRRDAVRRLPRRPARRQPDGAARRPHRAHGLRHHRPARRDEAHGVPACCSSARRAATRWASSRALRDLGAFPPDTDLDAVFTRSRSRPAPSTRRRSRPTSSCTSCRSSRRSCSSYGARAPKELMLFVKNMMFLDGAIATPRARPRHPRGGPAGAHRDRDAARRAPRGRARHRSRARQPSSTWTRSRPAMGCRADVERLTYREVQERREIIRERLEEKRRRK